MIHYSVLKFLTFLFLYQGLGPEVEGRRRTRSAAKGVPATPPPPAKKERKSSSTGKCKFIKINPLNKCHLFYIIFSYLARGRPKKSAEESSDSQTSETSVTENEEAKSNDDSKHESAETNSHEEKEETANNNAEASKVSDTYF